MNEDKDGAEEYPIRAGNLGRRLLAAFVLALTIAFSVYLLIDMTRAQAGGFASVCFLAILPAFLSALICYIGDPNRDRTAVFYWAVPLVLVGLVDVGAWFFFHEGVVCLIMLSPIWLGSGWLGVFALRSQRKRPLDPNIFKSSFLILPLLMGWAENQMSFAPHEVVLTRRVLIQASAAEVWPYAVSNAHIDKAEGRWTVSQNIIGLPRPRATVMRGQGVGAVRTAYWGDHINFDENITQWQPERRLAWVFSFTNSSLQDYTDKHISPDGPYLKIDSGDYTLTPAGPGKTWLTLRTRYIAKTHVNAYAELWGELMLGDIENNVLAIIKHRAEIAHARSFHSAHS